MFKFFVFSQQSLSKTPNIQAQIVAWKRIGAWFVYLLNIKNSEIAILYIVAVHESTSLDHLRFMKKAEADKRPICTYSVILKSCLQIKIIQ